MKMKTYQIKIEVNQCHLYEVKANSEEEAEAKLAIRDSWPDITNTGSTEIEYIDCLDGHEEVYEIEEVE
jgi:hypothetical protein